MNWVVGLLGRWAEWGVGKFWPGCIKFTCSSPGAGIVITLFTRERHGGRGATGSDKDRPHSWACPRNRRADGLAAPGSAVSYDRGCPAAGPGRRHWVGRWARAFANGTSPPGQETKISQLGPNQPSPRAGSAGEALCRMSDLFYGLGSRLSSLKGPLADWGEESLSLSESLIIHLGPLFATEQERCLLLPVCCAPCGH